MFAARPLPRIRIPIPALLALAAALLVPAAAQAARPFRDLPRPATDVAVIRGGVPGAAKAAGDTILLLGPAGSGAPHVGTFQDAGGNPAWNGWTSRDDSELDINPWHVDTYRVLGGAYSAWCGEARFPSCGPGDPDGGYGNRYRAALEWRGTVADPGQPCTVTVTSLANVDLEPGYDYAYLQVETAAGTIDLWSADGRHDAVAVGGSHTVQPGDYLGGAGDEVLVRFLVRSDGVWSDEDCFHPSAGAMQLDDVTITLSNGTGTSWGFEDGTLGPFTAPLPVKVGDFAKLWTGLEDIDPCVTNYSPQVAFVDDGLVVPGTGGAFCINWCYGPMGYIANTTGGLAGGDSYLHNAILSPAMAWPDPGRGGAQLAFGVYEHEDLSADAPGIFWTWAVRSAPGGDPADLEAAPWRSDNFVHYGRGNYERRDMDVSALLVPDRGQVQVRLAVWELGHVWGWDGDDGYPAPYFDNVRLGVFDVAGPALAAEERHLARDGFPAAGPFDPQDPGAASVRFDMARNVAPTGLPVVAGDSLVITATVVRHGAELLDAPRLHWLLRRNPAFDPYRTAGLPDAGSVACDSVRTAGGVPIADRWAADLPDEGFLFPGDVLHYYFSATDYLAGDLRTATLPADTAGFHDFGGTYRDSAYDRRFVVRALPAVTGVTWRQPPFLLWFDSDEDAAWERWQLIFAQLCLSVGSEVDVFTTRAAAARAGNGLGAAATAAHLADYDVIMYTCGALTGAVLGDGTASGDASPDIALLDAWLGLGSKGLVAGGDDLAYGLYGADGGEAFLAGRLGAQVVADDLRPLIGSQVSPRVIPTAYGPVFYQSWAIDGGCPTIRDFDAVRAVGEGRREAEFGAANGQPGYYSYAAAVSCVTPVTTWKSAYCVLLPYAPSRIVADPWGGTPYGLHPATVAVRDALSWAGRYMHPIGCIGDVPGSDVARRFGAAAHPNPFNPRVRIDYTVARPGRLTVTIHDLRGRLVRTLLDGPVTTGGSLDWDGTDEAGRQTASGVYFYLVRMDDQSTVGKLALIR